MPLGATRRVRRRAWAWAERHSTASSRSQPPRPLPDTLPRLPHLDALAIGRILGTWPPWSGRAPSGVALAALDVPPVLVQRAGEGSEGCASCGGGLPRTVSDETMF